MDIYSKIDEIGEYIQQAKVLPIVNQKVLDTEHMMRLLEELYASVPQEVKQSKETLEQEGQRKKEIESYSNDMVAKSNQECERLLKSAKEESQRLLNEDHLKHMVEEEARRIKTEVLEEVSEVRRKALEDVELLRRDSLEKARNLEEKAIEQAKRIKRDADTYAEEILNHIDANLAQIQSVTKNSRKFLSDLKEQDILQTAANN